MNCLYVGIAALGIAVFGVVPAGAQMVILDPDFSDGINPDWKGMPQHFTTVEADGRHMLRLNGDAGNGGTSWLSIPVHAAYGEWQFSVMLDFATSNNNRSYVHLFNDHENPREGSGYAIRIGESGSAKHFRLVRLDEGKESGVITHGDRLIETGKAYTLKISRSRTGIWQIWSAEGFEGSPEPDGLPGFDNTYSATGWFVFEAIYTATRADRFYWDNLRITKNPAFVLNAGRSGPNRISVTYSESGLDGAGDPHSYRLVRESAAELIHKTDVSAAGTATSTYPGSGFRSIALSGKKVTEPLSGVQDSSDPLKWFPVKVEQVTSVIYELIFESELSGGPARLELLAITDSYGQALERSDTELLLYDSPSAGSVVVNEFLYDDTGGLPQYVELYNPGPGWYNLQDWELRDRGSGRRVISEVTRTLEPYSFLVVTVNAQGLQNRFGSGPWLQMDRFPSLNRASSDQIRLIAPDGIAPDGLRVDSILYEPSVLQAGGRSVERRSALVGSSFAENWAVSEHESGGTPGMVNSAGPPGELAEISEIRPADALTINLQFSRPMDFTTMTASNIHLIPPIRIDSVSMDLSVPESDPGILFHLHLAESMINATEYMLNLESVADIFGLSLSNPAHMFIYYRVDEADYRDIVINEILYRPVDGTTPRFVELYNRSSRNIDLSGWTIGRSSASVKLTDSPGNIMIPGGYAVIAAQPGFGDIPASTLNFSVNLPGYSRFGDAVYIRNRVGDLIDTLYYHPSWGGDADGISLERLDPDAASNDPANWRSNPAGYSAGGKNLNYEPDLTPPGIIKAIPGSDNTAKILFTEFLDTGSPPGIRAGNAAAEIVDFDAYSANRLTIQLPFNPAGEETKIEVYEAIDAAGNRASYLELPLAHPPLPDDLVINEIMYQPLQNRYGSFPDQTQYVEFINRSNRTVSLSGLHLHDMPDKNGIVRTVVPSGHETAWLPPGALGLIHADTSANFSKTALSGFFHLEPSPVWLQAMRSTLNLTSSGRPLYLAGHNGLILDSLTYLPEWHNPNLADKRGISLERIRPAGPSDDARNWSSNVLPEGGTPGAANSIHQEPVQHDLQRTISLSPNPFSPDSDGHDDHLFISYRLDSPEYLVTIRIYDRYGRLVRRLADRERAGFEGNFIWDGLDENGITGRIGIYIILFDAQDPVNGKILQLKQTAVLARHM